MRGCGSGMTRSDLRPVPASSDVSRGHVSCLLVITVSSCRPPDHAPPHPAPPQQCRHDSCLCPKQAARWMKSEDRIVDCGWYWQENISLYSS